MNRRYSTRLFRKVLVPVIHGVDSRAAVNAALLIADRSIIDLVGIVGIAEGESLSSAALPARHVRKVLRGLATSADLHAMQRIRVSHKPWDEVMQVVREESADLLIMEAAHLPLLDVNDTHLLRHPPCDVVIAGGNVPPHAGNVLISLRGGPYAELSLRLGLSMMRTSKAGITALHVSPMQTSRLGDPAFMGADKVLKNLPKVKRKTIKTDDPQRAILEAAQESDMLVMGAPAWRKGEPLSVGPIAEALLRSGSRGVLVVKSRRPLPSNMESEVAGQNAISILVDRWFADRKSVV